MGEGFETDSNFHLDLKYLRAAIMAMEPPDCVLSLARKCNGGSLTEEVQNFILECCIKSDIDKCNEPDLLYIKNILKKVITAAESRCELVSEGLYEQYTHYISSFKDCNLFNGSIRVLKHISFFFSEGTCGVHLRAKEFIVPLQCSINMLEGDTGCVIWPSSLFLSEFIFSYPNIFYNKFCIEVGSGVGLVGIALNKVKASKVILSDGDLSSLANLKHNLELNQLGAENEVAQNACNNPSSVKWKYLPWETVSEIELRGYQPDIVLGADVIYNPSCVPHLIRVLSILLTRKISHSSEGDAHDINSSEFSPDYEPSCIKSVCSEGRVAYIATVIRNIETYSYFLKLANEANLSVVDITETSKPLNLLPYMLSFDRSSVHLYKIFSAGQ